MQLKILIFSIFLSGSSVTKTILYNEEEYVAIEEYAIDDIDLKKDSASTKVSYYKINADQVLQLIDDSITKVPKKMMRLDSWTSVGMDTEGSLSKDIQKIDEEHIQVSKNNALLNEKTLFKKLAINEQLAKAMPLVLEHEDALYVTESSSTFDSQEHKIFHIKLVENRVATVRESKIFERYKKVLSK